ncbi:MAG: ribosome assembly factor SBDS [Candidatus Diapherotrites archaeon]
MVKMEDAVIARFESKGEKFEMLVDPDLAMDLKEGREVNFNDLLVIDTVFKDANKGDEKSEEKVKEIFGTAGINEIAKKIILEGEVQLTTAQRREIMARKRKEIVAFIAMNAVNPQTKTPHPPQRIENAIEEAKLQIDFGKTVQEQIPEFMKELRKLIPISLEQLKLAIRIPAEHAGKAEHILHKYKLQKEEWQKDGSLIAVVEIPAGMKQELFNEINAITHGEVESKILEE